MRAVYGDHQLYASWAAEARPQWEEIQEQTKKALFEPVGVLWLVNEHDYPGKCQDACRRVGVDVVELDLDEARKRYPHVSFEAGVSKAYLESPAGFLRARRACEATVEQYEREGGRRLALAVFPGELSGGRMIAAFGVDGTRVEADHFVFACGPWLPRLFPDELGGGVIEITRQVEHHFEIPMVDETPPACIDFSDPIFYGLVDIENDRSEPRCILKVGEDTRGKSLGSIEQLDEPNGADEGRVRELLAKRFPRFRYAACHYRRTCAYSNTPQGDYLIDRLPSAENTWLIGGGSSHAFKMGPMIGRTVTGLVTGQVGETPPTFSLARHRRDAESGVFQTPFESGRDEKRQGP